MGDAAKMLPLSRRQSERHGRESSTSDPTVMDPAPTVAS
jgi:hypothetical protein